MQKVRIGFIGLGKMGNPMSRRLIDAGYELVVYDVVKQKAMELAVSGARIADSPEDTARQTNVVLLSIPGDPQLLDTCLGEHGVLAGAVPETILIDMSTVTPAASAEVAQAAEQKRVTYLRAPVSGSTVLAAEGQLSIFVSGDRSAYVKSLPILNVLGKRTTYVGPKEEAKYVKLLLNMMVATTAQMVAEALTFGERAGIDWKTMIEVIGQSVVASPLIGYKLRPLLEKDMAPAFTVKQMEKDLDYVLEAGRQIGAAMPLASLVRQFLAAAEATGKGEMDFFSLLLLMEEISGIKNNE
jgi:3-hydroxyisobutyrate dehydrogenase-like beta-hydroxyacid dehydrogenase